MEGSGVADSAVVEVDLAAGAGSAVLVEEALGAAAPAAAGSK